MTLYDQLLGHYRSSDRNVLVTSDGDGWNVNRLEHCAALIHSKLRSMGVDPGDRVLVQVSKTPECLALYLCCLHCGFIFVPLNTAYTVEELSYFLADAEPAVLVLDSMAAKPANCQVAVVALSSLSDAKLIPADGVVNGVKELESYRETPAVAGKELACIIYTSGTTGRPKGAALSHGNLLENGLALSRAWGFSPDDVLLHSLPVYHVHGLFIALHSALLGGAQIRFLSQFSPHEVVDALPGCTVMMGVPTYYSRLLDVPEFSKDQCANLRVIISGSAPLPVELFNAFKERTGHTILERYGMSETNIISSNPLTGERIPGTVGFALEGTRIRIADAQDNALLADETGAVQVQGPGVFAGYWRKPETTRQEFTSDGYFRTGDLGQLDVDGRLTLKGRSKDLIITGGLNVYPAEIERCLDALPGVLESAVIGAPDTDFGERVEAFIVSDGSDDNLVVSLQAMTRRELANFKRPKAFHLIESLPRNTMGKVQKTVLRGRLNCQ